MHKVSAIVRRGVIATHNPAFRRLVVLSRARGSEVTTIGIVSEKDLGEHISRTGFDVYVVLNPARLFERLSYDREDIFYDPKERALKLKTKKRKP